jgi:oligoendopeptidase F
MIEESTNQTAIKKSRFFINNNLVINTWEDIETYFITLEKFDISFIDNLNIWLKQLSELEAIVQEELAWRYIKHTCDTTNKELDQKLNYYYSEIEPKAQKYFDTFNRKLLASPALKELDQNKFGVYIRSLKKATEIFREENLSIQAEIQNISSEYGKIAASMTIEHEGKEMTFNQAANFLKVQDRELRKEIYTKILSRRDQDKDALNSIFNQLLEKRHQIALNAGFENYRDYMFAELGRFDYSAEDCSQFHDAIIKHVVPAIDAFEIERKNKLGYDSLKPYDLDVDPNGKEPLKIFSTGNELFELTLKNFKVIDPFFGNVIEQMNKLGHLDLESRKGKAPGGYNYPLYESGYPFIYMNAAGDLRDVITMAHEGGHAVHAVLADELELSAFKHTPSEIAEVASMAMELIAMEHWDTVFQDQDELKRAKHIQLEKILSVLPWIACVDEFQHWLYVNPTHSQNEREEKWIELLKKTSGNVLDRSEFEKFSKNSWHKQLHIFEVPFYYIEYAIAQLGAIGIWKNYKENPLKALHQYKEALELGYTKTLPELYTIAGISFNFSAEYVQELVSFVLEEKARI